MSFSEKVETQAALPSGPDSRSGVPGRSTGDNATVSEGDERADTAETQTRHLEPGPPALRPPFRNGAPEATVGGWRKGGLHLDLQSSSRTGRLSFLWQRC